jgi:hypothetical protein
MSLIKGSLEEYLTENPPECEYCQAGVDEEGEILHWWKDRDSKCPEVRMREADNEYQDYVSQ